MSDTKTSRVLSLARIPGKPGESPEFSLRLFVGFPCRLLVESPGSRLGAMDADLELLRRVSRATVTVMAQVPTDHASVAVLGAGRLGTGTIVGESGLVVTVNYVVVGATAVGVVDTEGHHREAQIVAHDYASGIAVLRTSSFDVEPLAPAVSDPIACGEDVFVVSSVGGAERRANAGIVMSLDPFDAYWEYCIDPAIWLSAANPGLGGGPVCNARGEIVGVVSLNLGAVGRATLAIPAENYFSHAAEMLSEGRRSSRPRRAWLGMFCHELPDRTVVAGVIPGSPGDRCGMQPGDLIVRVDQVPVSRRLQVYEQIWMRKPGEIVEVEIDREGSLATLNVEAGDAEEFFS